MDLFCGYNFLTTLYRGAGIQTHVSRVAPYWGPLKDALPSELQGRGNLNILEMFP